MCKKSFVGMAIITCRNYTLAVKAPPDLSSHSQMCQPCAVLYLASLPSLLPNAKLQLAMDTSQFGNEEYTVGWICALQEEFDVATAMLDSEHGLPQSLPEHDTNAYILGEIGQHKIVMACFPAGGM